MRGSDPEKAALRSIVLKARAALTDEEVARNSAVIMEKIMALDAYKKSKIVMCYLNFKNEVITDELIGDALRQSKKVFVPVIEIADTGDRVMRASQLLDQDSDLKVGVMGIREPGRDKRVYADPAGIDLYIVPGVAYDCFRNRLGFGGGYHDRFLPELRSDCLTIAPAYDFQVFERIPTTNHDIPVKMIVTEIRII